MWVKLTPHCDSMSQSAKMLTVNAQEQAEDRNQRSVWQVEALSKLLHKLAHEKTEKQEKCHILF